MTRVAAVVLVLVLAASGCVGGVTEVQEVPDVERVISATTAIEGITFTSVLWIAGTEYASTRGVLDLVTGEGYREDAVLVGAAGVQPVAEVWLADGVAHQRELGEDETEVVYGSTASFLSITTAPDARTLEEALRRTFDGRGWEAIASEQIEGEESVISIAATPANGDQRFVEVAVDHAHIIREMRVLGREERKNSVLVITFTPGRVEVPVRPE